MVYGRVLTANHHIHVCIRSGAAAVHPHAQQAQGGEGPQAQHAYHSSSVTNDDEDFYTQLLADDDEDAGADDAAGMDVDAAAPEVISLV